MSIQILRSIQLKASASDNISRDFFISYKLSSLDSYIYKKIKKFTYSIHEQINSLLIFIIKAQSNSSNAFILQSNCMELFKIYECRQFIRMEKLQFYSLCNIILFSLLFSILFLQVLFLSNTLFSLITAWLLLVHIEFNGF